MNLLRQHEITFFVAEFASCLTELQTRLRESLALRQQNEIGGQADAAAIAADCDDSRLDLHRRPAVTR